MRSRCTQYRGWVADACFLSRSRAHRRVRHIQSLALAVAVVSMYRDNNNNEGYKRSRPLRRWDVRMRQQEQQEYFARIHARARTGTFSRERQMASMSRLAQPLRYAVVEQKDVNTTVTLFRPNTLYVEQSGGLFASQGRSVLYRPRALFL